MLKFSKANSKLVKLEKKTGKKVYSLSLPSGETCPMALLCMAKAVKLPNGKTTVKDGPNTEFRCYSASQEALYPGLWNLTRHNFQEMEAARRSGGAEEIADLIVKSLPAPAEIVRINESGDIYNRQVLEAWILAAKRLPHVVFYGYTKSVHWLAELKDSFPVNLKLTASFGGRLDNLIELHNLPNVKVVNSKYEARKLKRVVDTTDFHAFNGTSRFSLVVHGTQPANTKAAKAWNRIKRAKMAVK